MKKVRLPQLCLADRSNTKEAKHFKWRTFRALRMLFQVAMVVRWGFFGMEGILVTDIADYKRRKEIELGPSADSISQPSPKRVKVENRPFSEEELRRQLEERKALMSHGESESSTVTEPNSSAVYNAAPQTYVSSPVHVNQDLPTMPAVGPAMPLPGFFPPGAFPERASPLPPYFRQDLLFLASHRRGFQPGGPPSFPPGGPGPPLSAVPPFMPQGASPSPGSPPIPPC